MNWLYSLIPFPTKKGKLLIFIAIGILMAGINTGNNLLYLIFSAVLSVFTVSYLAAGYLLRFIDLRLRLPYEINAGEEFALSLIVDNTNGKIPVMVESLKILLSQGTQDHTKILNQHRSGEEDLCFAVPGKACAGSRYMMIPKRGMYRIARLQVMVTCPLGLVRRRLKREMDYEIIVYPEMKRSELLSSSRHSIPLLEGSGEGQGNGDLFNIRDYIIGDDSRFIDWKSTAKVGRFMTKEMRGGESSRITIYFDRNPGPDFETRVGKTAWFSNFFLSNGYELRFVSDEIEVPPERGSLQRKEILTYLSTVQPLGTKDALKHVPSFLRDSKVFVVHERGEMALASDGRQVKTEQK